MYFNSKNRGFCVKIVKLNKFIKFFRLFYYVTIYKNNVTIKNAVLHNYYITLHANAELKIVQYRHFFNN